jgi:hypothetical protein
MTVEARMAAAVQRGSRHQNPEHGLAFAFPNASIKQSRIKQAPSRPDRSCV